jgi:hypothetical protein|tara:strand:+ start:60 stop:548 length:489 start_codon:yes stop_codon:yes gene_type:complete
MAVQETYRPLLHEMFTKINNKKDRPGKIKILQQYDTNGLRMVLKAAFDPKIVWLVPEGDVPYITNDAPDGTEHTRLEQQARTLQNYVGVKQENGAVTPAAPQINNMKREMLFIQLLEGLSAGEAEVLISVKNKTLNKTYKGLNASTVKEAFNWNDDYLRKDQ